MAKVDDLLERRAKQVVLAIVARLAHRSPPTANLAVVRNHGPPKSGIPNRKKTGMHTRLSCKIDYLLRSNHRDRSIASSFFTDFTDDPLPQASRERDTDQGGLWRAGQAR